MQILATDDQDSSEIEVEEESEEEGEATNQGVTSRHTASELKKISSRPSIHSESEHSKKAKLYMQWLVDEERQLL